MGLKSTLAPFQQANTTTFEGSSIAQSISDMLRPLLAKEILDGRLVSEISLATGVTNHVSHKLQRAIQGWIVVKSNADSRFWDGEDSNINRQAFLDLHCSANCVVSLWVF